MTKPIHTADERCYDYDETTGLARLRIETATHPEIEYADIYARLEVETDSDGITCQTAYLDHADGEASDAQIEYALRAIECNDTGVACD